MLREISPAVSKELYTRRRKAVEQETSLEKILMLAKNLRSEGQAN